MRLAERWVAFADRRRAPLLALAAAAALLGLWGTVRLYADLRPDLSELLPARSRSALDLAAVTGRVGGWAEASIVLTGADAGTLELFADDLAEALAQAPDGLVRWVEHKTDAARDFFQRRVLLFLTEAELRELRDTLAARQAWEAEAARGGAARSGARPGQGAAGASPRPDHPGASAGPRPDHPGASAGPRPDHPGASAGPRPDLEGLVKRLSEGRQAQLGRGQDGYFVGEVPGRRAGEKMTALAMLVRLGGDQHDYGRVTALDRFIKATVARLDPKRSSPTLEVAYGGFVASNIMEHDALAEDLVWATLLVVLAVAAAMAVYNRTWKAVPAVGLPLLCGTFVTFGLAELLVGHLNSNTAFLGSIVVGNGINVGLIFFARYLEERRHGQAPLPAMTVAVDQTWLATLTAALAAGVSYASLLSTDFRGFNQFGLIGGLGMSLAWLTAYLVTPPLVLAWERRSPLVRPGEAPTRPLFTHLVSLAVDRAPRVTLAAAALLSVAAVVMGVRFARDPFEYDFRRLRDRSAMAVGAPGWWDERVDAIFGSHLTPTVLLARDEVEAREIARRLEAHRAATPGSTLGGVLSVATLVPERQAEKLPLIREIAGLARGGLSFLPPDQQMAVQAVLPPDGLAPFTAADLPPELRRQLTEVDGRLGTPVLVYPDVALDVWDGRSVLRHAEELRSVALPRGDVPMASSMLVFADVMAAIRQDGPRATWLSLAGVVLLVLLAFGLGGRRARDLADAGWVLASLGLGVLWFVGLAGAFGLRLNMLNFIALPITFGIGVDYAVNVFQRRRLDHARSIADCVRTTGGAVALCSLTTMIGYSSLLIARNQALVSFGWLADVGEVACLAAALLALPAFLRWRELRQGVEGGGPTSG